MYQLACVAWRFLSKLSELEVRKRGSRDDKPQSREEPGRETTEKPPAWRAGSFCKSSTLAHGPLPLDKKANTSISQGTPPRNNTDYNVDLWQVNRKTLLNILCEYREIGNCQTRARNNRKEFPSWESCDGRFPNRRSQKDDFYRVLLFALAR